MMNEDEEVMNEMKKKYPEMSGTYVFNFNKIILDGMDKKSFEAELAKQIDHLKCYIFECYTNDQDSGNGLHPRFVEDVLEFDKEYTKNIIDSHLNKNISYQTIIFAGQPNRRPQRPRLHRVQSGVHLRRHGGEKTKLYN